MGSNKYGTIKHYAYIKGYPDGTFRPDREITRAEAAVIFARIMNLEVQKEYENIYKDVSIKHWASNYIQAVTEAGVFKGYKDNTFSPEAPITRAELAVVISKYLKLISVRPLNLHFNDIEDHWALNYIEGIARFNIIDGYEDCSFRPDQKIKRSEAVSMINKMLNRGPLKIKAASFPDVEAGHWAFGQVEEASRDHNFMADSGGEIFVE